MTKKEAIAHLYTHSSTNGSGQTTQAQHEEAKRMAIEALIQPEIIRCKDCEKYRTMFCAIDIWTEDITIYIAKPDDFCSRAERREE